MEQTDTVQSINALIMTSMSSILSMTIDQREALKNLFTGTK